MTFLKRKVDAAQQLTHSAVRPKLAGEPLLMSSLDLAAVASYQ